MDVLRLKTFPNYKKSKLGKSICFDYLNQKMLVFAVVFVYITFFCRLWFSKDFRTVVFKSFHEITKRNIKTYGMNNSTTATKTIVSESKNQNQVYWREIVNLF